VLWFGAKGDASSDDQAAFNAINTLLPVTGGEIYIPAGCYSLSQSWQLSNKPVTIRGAGVKITMLFFTGTTDGIVYSGSDLSQTLTIEGFSVISLSNGTTTGLNVSFPVNLGSSWKNCTIRDMIFDGSSSIAAYQSTNVSQGAARWGIGISCNNVAGLTIDNVHVRGRYSTKDSVGIYLTGWTVDLRLVNCILQFHNVAVFKVGELEGFNIDHCTGLSCNVFIRLWNSNPPVAGAAGGVSGFISNCHSGNTIRGIDIWRFPQTFITNCLLYQDATSPANTQFAHIFASSSDSLKIIGNHMQGSDGSHGWNVQLAGCYAPVISSNFCWGTYFSVSVDSASVSPIITGNHMQGRVSNGASGTAAIANNIAL